MAELADQGLVRAIGLSNYTLARIEACHAARPVDVIQDGLSLVDYPENRHKVAACGWQGIAAVIYEPLASGLLAGAYASAADVRAKWGDDVDSYEFFGRLFGPGQEPRSMALTAECERVAEQTRSRHGAAHRLGLALAGVLGDRGSEPRHSEAARRDRARRRRPGRAGGGDAARPGLRLTVYCRPWPSSR